MNKLKELFGRFSSEGLMLTVAGIILSIFAGKVADRKQDLAIDRAVDRRIRQLECDNRKEDEDEKND